MNETVELEPSNKTIHNLIINNSIYSFDEVVTDYLNFSEGGRNDNMLKYTYLLDNNYLAIMDKLNYNGYVNTYVCTKI